METWLKMRFAPLFWTGAMHLGEHDIGIFNLMIMKMRKRRATNQTKKAHLARR